MGNKMKDWLEKNQEVYNKFKSKIHSTLDLLSQNGTDVAECDDTDSLQNMYAIGSNGRKGYAS